MKIGEYEVISVHGGAFRLDGGAMFGVVPKPLWEKTNPPDESNRIDMAMRCLVARGEGRVILVDTGVGSKYDEKFASIFAIDHSEHELVRALADRGLSPDDVTDVIMTHLHFDHGGGLTRRDGDVLSPQFPNARVHVQRSHWEHAMEPNERDRASFLRENYEPLREHSDLNLLEGDATLFPGIDVVVVHGHSPSMQLVKVYDRDCTLLYCADLIPTASHLPYPYIMGYDLEPLKTLAEKKTYLPLAAEEGWILAFEHDPAVEAGYVHMTGRHFELAEAFRLDEL